MQTNRQAVLKEIAQLQLGILRVDILRDRRDRCFPMVSLIRKGCLEGGFSLADIGTTGEEIKGFLIKGCEEDIHRYLAILRDGIEEDDYGFYTALIRSRCQERGLSLADVGIDEEEIRDFSMKGGKKAVQRYLDLLRKGSDCAPPTFLIRSKCQEGGFSLADVGSSEEELKAFAEKSKTK